MGWGAERNPLPLRLASSPGTTMRNASVLLIYSNQCLILTGACKHVPVESCAPELFFSTFSVSLKFSFWCISVIFENHSISEGEISFFQRAGMYSLAELKKWINIVFLYQCLGRCEKRYRYFAGSVPRSKFLSC